MICNTAIGFAILYLLLICGLTIKRSALRISAKIAANNKPLFTNNNTIIDKIISLHIRHVFKYLKDF